MEGQSPDRLDGRIKAGQRKVGATVVWCKEAHTPPPWGPSGRHAERAFRPPYHPRPQAAGWTRRRHRLGDNKEVFDSELYQALKIFGARRGWGQLHCLFGLPRGVHESDVRPDQPRPSFRQGHHRGGGAANIPRMPDHPAPGSGSQGS